MKVQNYKELIVWQKSIELVEETYKVTKQLPLEERFGLTSQMQRAAVGISSSIAEGASRNGSGEFGYFLGVSYASSAELETQLVICKRIYPKIGCSKAETLNIEVQKMLNGLMSKIIKR